MIIYDIPLIFILTLIPLIMLIYYNGKIFRGIKERQQYSMPDKGWKRKAFKRKAEGDANSKETSTITKENGSSENSVFNSYAEAMKDKNRFIETAIKENLMRTNTDNPPSLGKPCVSNKSNTSIQIKTILCRNNGINRKVNNGETVPIAGQTTNDDKGIQGEKW